jgi:hypothetical protein
VTSSWSSLQAVTHSPMWFRITTHNPIRREEENKAASQLMKTVPSDCGVPFDKTKVKVVNKC